MYKSNFKYTSQQLDNEFFKQKGLCPCAYMDGFEILQIL